MADTEDIAEGAEAAPPKKSKKKLIIIAAAALLLVGGGAGAYFKFFAHGAKHEEHAEAPPPKPPVFLDVPEVLVNLSVPAGERPQFLKFKIVLEIKDAPLLAQVQPNMPRIMDIFQTYTRELRSADLNGSAGIFRLKEELTRRVNAAVSPAQINAVLFKEIVVQ